MDRKTDKRPNVFVRVWRWIKNAFENPAKLARDTRAIVYALRLLRNALNSPAAAEAVKLIPGQVDDAILVAIKTALDRILGIADAWEKLPDLWGAKEHPMDHALLHKTGSEALRQLHDMPEAEADLRIQEAYNITKPRKRN